jgi:prepilin-type processing-associated H-X9-DG protein
VAWERIVTWLHTNAPVTAAHLAPPVTPDDLMVVESLLGTRLPADLSAWWHQSCGVTGFVEGRLIPPSYAPYTVDEAVDCREVMLEIASAEDVLAEPAGSPNTVWLPEWLPIAHDGGGNYLFADLRPGPLTGCVMEWDEYEAVTMAPRWPNTSTMLAEIAEVLEHGTDVDGYHPDPHDGVLDWG